jgi:hypothetical protein
MATIIDWVSCSGFIQKDLPAGVDLPASDLESHDPANQP